MTPWIAIVDEDLNDCLAGPQMDALREAALADGQADPFQNAMTDRINYLRNRISKRVMLSATPLTVPPELKTCACWLIIEAMALRLAIALELTTDQRTMRDRCYKDLDIAGTEAFPISKPLDPISSDVQGGGAVRIVTSTTRQATGGSMRGL